MTVTLTFLRHGSVLAVLVYSKLLMLTAGAMVQSGFDVDAQVPVQADQIRPNTAAVKALYAEMLNKARQRPETLYGAAPEQIARGKMQVLAVADEFPRVMQDLIASGVKTHFKEYDTSVAGKANTGHGFGADLCPDTAGLDPTAHRQAIAQRLLGSDVGALLAYLKTL
jgi:hypothetical protein